VTPTPCPYLQEGDKFTGSGAVGNAQFGVSVAVSADGNTAIAGGPLDSGGRGAAWILHRENGVWTQRVRLSPEDAIGRSRFGISVALSADGNTAVVGGAAGDNLNAGAVWVYVSANGIWQESLIAPAVKLTGTGGTGNAVQMGASVAISAAGTKIVAGAPGDDTGTGAVWSFVGQMAFGYSREANCWQAVRLGNHDWVLR
jgi:hypothetical protein